MWHLVWNTNWSITHKKNAYVVQNRESSRPISTGKLTARAAEGTLSYSVVKFGAVSLGDVRVKQSRLGFISFLLPQNCPQEATQEWQPTPASLRWLLQYRATANQLRWLPLGMLMTALFNHLCVMTALHPHRIRTGSAQKLGSSTSCLICMSAQLPALQQSKPQSTQGYRLEMLSALKIQVVLESRIILNSVTHVKNTSRIITISN